MRRIVGGVLLLVCVAWCVSARPVVAGAPLEVEKIKAALRTATQEEDGFIQYVSDLVVRDVLPRKLVESTFLWAKAKPDHRFQYFKRGLKVRAARQGIRL